MNDKSNIKTPLDPSGDFAEIINDTTGVSGITTNNSSQTPPSPNTNSNVGSSSNAQYDVDQEIAEGNIEKDSPKEKLANATLDDTSDNSYLQNETLNSAYAENLKGEQSVSGTTPDPGSDDDVLRSTHEVGLAQNEDEKHPQDLDIGGDIDRSEEYQKTH